MSEIKKLSELLKKNKLKGTHSSQATRHFLNTGYPPLNKIISGDHQKGIPSGQLTMIAGPSASGKTMISTQLMISAQEAGGFAAFFDYERQYQMTLAESQGLDTDEEKFQYYKPTTYEEGISQAIKLAALIRDNDVIGKDAPIVFIFDSLHAMTPQSKYDSLFGKEGSVEKGKKTSMHDNFALSAANAAWAATINAEFDKYGVTGIFLNQVRVKTDMHGNTSYTFPGGDTLWFYCSNVLVLTGKNITDGTGDKKQLVKKDIKCLTQKSRNTRPFQNVHWDFVFDETGKGDFDVIGSYIDYLGKLGIFEQSGSWFTFNGEKFQGLGKIKAHYVAEEDGLKQLIEAHQKFLEENPTATVAETDESVTEEA